MLHSHSFPKRTAFEIHQVSLTFGFCSYRVYHRECQEAKVLRCLRDHRLHQTREANCFCNFLTLVEPLPRNNSGLFQFSKQCSCSFAPEYFYYLRLSKTHTHICFKLISSHNEQKNKSTYTDLRRHFSVNLEAICDLPAPPIPYSRYSRRKCCPGP